MTNKYKHYIEISQYISSLITDENSRVCGNIFQKVNHKTIDNPLMHQFEDHCPNDILL